MIRKFIQFYQVKEDWNFPGTTAVYLHNGFHYIWEEAQPEWLKLEHGSLDMVPEADEIYLTVSGFVGLWKAYEWAIKAPQTKIIIGGPAVRVHKIQSIVELPPNLIMNAGLAEEIFNKPQDPESFYMVPPLLVEGSHYCYAYPYKTFCQWGKCTYCTEPKTDRERNWSLRPLLHAPPGHVHMTTINVGSQELLDFRNLNYDDKFYLMGIRANPAYLPALKELVRSVPINKILFKCGVEFPSNRMLKYMQKGLTVEDYITFINGASEMGCNVALSFITHWGVLEDSDVEEAKNFFTAIRHKWTATGASAQIPLIGYLKLDDRFQHLYHEKPVLVGPFLVGHYIKLDDNQRRINNTWIRLLQDEGVKRQVVKSNVD